MPPLLASGLDFGWDFMEGGHGYPPESGLDDAKAASSAAPYGTLSGCSLVGVRPVAEYEHSLGCSITGMGVHRGSDFGNLDGIYFASDFCSGRVWGLAQDDNGAWQFAQLLHTSLLVTGSGVSESGNVYLTTRNCMFSRNYDPFANQGPHSLARRFCHQRAGRRQGCLNACAD